MPNRKINWVNDHTEICDHFDERVQRMQDYLDSNPTTLRFRREVVSCVIHFR